MARKRIGLQTARLEYGYGVKIWQGAMACAEKLDSDLIVFPGRNLDAPHDFDYQYNRIFRLMSKENLDALILVTTLISDYIDEAELLKFCSSFEGLPLISIGLKIPGVPSLVVDNRAGIRDLVRHMATKHGASRIAFVRGPESNWEANERYLAYREELDCLGIPFDERLVARGDFTSHSVRPALEELLKNNEAVPDAFLFANDEMAIKGMRLLRDKRREIPGMAAVAGFDDIAEASTQSTPLTTVRQPLFEMAWQAFAMAGDRIDGKQVPELTVLPTEPVIRSSCGCLVHSVDDIRSLDRIVRNKEAGTEGRSDCLSLAMSALQNDGFEKLHHVEARRDSIRAILDKLLELCAPAAAGGLEGSSAQSGDEEESSFISSFGEVLKEESQAGLQLGDWQFILPALSDSIERVFPRAIDAHRLKFLVHSCMVMSSEMASIRQNGINYEANNVNLVLREVQYGLSSIIHLDDLAETLKAQLPRLNIDSFFASRFEKEWPHELHAPWNIPERSIFVVGLLDGIALRAAEDEAVFPSSRLYPPSLVKDGKRRTLAAYPLFFRDLHYGTIVFEMTHLNGFVYESLATQVSGILKAIILYRAKEKAEDNLRQAMMELEKFNQQLSNLSLTDELTGLYNRRGFMRLASQQLSLTKQMGKNALLIYGDLDGLKGINDNFGHEEGDFAIKAAAEVVRKVFRTMDVLARIGGDEFTIFASNTNEKRISFFQARISEFLRELNSSSGKPYEVSMSLGCSECLPGSELSLDEHLREADARLYAQKVAKKRAPPAS